ncbi:hypothetical protein BH09MYX1_BH09MYX1_20050 [soil metagenome]
MAAFVWACHDDQSAAVDADLEGSMAALDLDATADAGVDAEGLAWEARLARVSAARGSYDAGTWDGPELYSAAARTSVMSAPAWSDPSDGGQAAKDAATDGSQRLGYLRHGSHAPAFAEPIVNEDCADGWYELIEGGFVCGKYASTDPKNPAVKFAANPPQIDKPMPYRYGFSMANDTPVYKRVLALSDRRKFEPWLGPPPGARLDATAGAAPLTLDAGIPSAGDEDNPYDDPPAEPTHHPKKGSPIKDAGVREAGPRLEELRGKGALARKMNKGFYVALDRDFMAAKAHWWRTSEGFAIPYERLALQTWWPEFHGNWGPKADLAAQDGGAAPEGNGTTLLLTGDYGIRYVEDEKGKLKYTTPIPKLTPVELSGDPRTEGGVVYQRTTAGFWVRLADGIVPAVEPPSDLGPNEKWIDVDLQKELLVAFEGKHAVYATKVSSGRRNPYDPEHDFPTPTGTFRIYEKHVSVTMDGNVAADGPYSIEDVPWVMYFQGSYALHGAFWHNGFGSPRSHGCVNLAPTDARELFFWTEPRLPVGWHGVFQTGSQPGTRVVLHEPPLKSIAGPR